MATKFYNSKNLHPLVNGVEILQLSDGDDAITVKYRQDRAQDKVGMDGSMSVAITADRTGEITLKLMQTSPSNAYLLGLAAGQEALNGQIPIQFMFQDTLRQDRAIGSAGYIKTIPDITRGAGINTQDWVFVVERLDLVLGAL